MATFLVMYIKGDLLMERISLGALIIALCMLTDNAIIVIEGIKVGIEAGKDKLRSGPRGGRPEPVAALRSDGHRRHRLRRDRPVGGSDGRILQLAVLGHPDFPEPELDVVGHRHSALELPVFQAERRCGTCRKQRSVWRPVLPALPQLLGSGTPLPLGGGGSVASDCSSPALYGFTKVNQSFFPPATRPQFMVDAFLPAGTHIRESEAFADTVEQYIQAQPGVTHVTSFIGGGGLRFLLVYTPGKGEPSLRAVPRRCR